MEKRSVIFSLTLVVFFCSVFAQKANDNLVLIKSGTFLMGSPASERQRQGDERQHSVILSSFYISPFEVSQKEYQNVMGKNPSYFKGENLPVENITWYDAIEYCNRLSEKRGLAKVYEVNGKIVKWDRNANGYRLPTEAEWEYSCRSGTESIFFAGSQITSRNANFQGHYPYLIEENYLNRKDPSVVTSENRGRTIEVKSLSPNAFGLYNMHGNVSEWCFDYYGEYDTSKSTDPTGAPSGSLRINRGGAYNDFGKQLRSAYRSVATPNTFDQNTGFRIARNDQSKNEIVRTTYILDVKCPSNPRILVAYFSYSGNTKNGAEIIAQKTGGTLFEIKMGNPYTRNIYDVSQSDLNKNARPELASKIQNMAQYDVIILGYPTWWSTMPMPIYTFLEQYDFAGKIIMPFSSHGSTRFGDSISDLAKTARGAYVGHGFEYEYSGGRSLSNKLISWLKNSGIKTR